MSIETQTFTLRTVLTVTTGRLLTESEGPRDNGIGRMYKLLGWMTSDEPFTHQLGRFSEECKPWLLRWFPELAAADELLDEMDVQIETHGAEIGIKAWVDRLLATHKGIQRTYDVPKIPRDDHIVKNAYDELVEMRGTDEGIIVVAATDIPSK